MISGTACEAALTTASTRGLFFILIGAITGLDHVIRLCYTSNEYDM